MNDTKKITIVDDSVDFGKEPLPLDNPEAEKIHKKLLNKYGIKK